MYTFVKTCQIIHLKLVHFYVCKLCLNKDDPKKLKTKMEGWKGISAVVNSITKNIEQNIKASILI